MTNIVPLDPVDHHDLRVAFGPSARFGDAVNQVRVLPTEIDVAQREFPLFLRRDEAGRLLLVALLGLDLDENLFLEEDGWSGRHIPLLIQKGPFLIGLGAADDGGDPQRALHVDLDHPRVGAADGQPLFLPHGGQTLFFTHMLKILDAIHDGAAAEPAMLQAWDDAGLLEPTTLRVTLDEDSHRDIESILLVAPARLAELDGSTLERLNRQGFLRPAFMVAQSLANLDTLVERKARRRVDF